MKAPFYLPLRAVPREEQEISGQRVIENDVGGTIGYISYGGDAEHIVHAANAYPELVRTLRVVRNQSLGPDCTADQAMAWG